MTINLPVPADDFGPAMQALNERQREFVIGFTLYGLNQAQAYKAAGYSTSSKDVIDTGASRLMHTESVQAAILEVGQSLMRSKGPKAIMVLDRIMDDPEAGDKDKIKAATELLSRSGFVATTRQDVNVRHTHRTREELESYIASMASKYGHDVSQLLGRDDPNIIDVEAESVTEAPTSNEIPDDLPDEIKDLF